ncbi:Imm49 family immunity protein [Streptomyces sp. NPDC094448]|uniref:immunity 49 family protein n=1 Tax=Streptomyces sp. NPDC094448 TaxID=3366063 RepID=UPI0037FBA6A3
MRIERHEVEPAAVAGVLNGFTERIAREAEAVEHGPRPADGWRLVAGSLLGYAAARSVAHPGLTDRDARSAFESAAAAAVGSVALASGRGGGFRIGYTGSVIGDPAPGPGPGPAPAPGLGRPAAVRPGAWLTAFLLSYIAGTADEHGPLFVATAAPLAGHEARPDVALAHALLIHVHGQVEGGPEARPGPERARLVAALCDRLDPDPALGRQYRAALVTLRALAADDEAGFGRALAAQLLEHRAVEASYASPTLAGLLPLEAIALAAMAVRRKGWVPGVDSAYLPYGPVSGFRPRRGRVAAYGRDKGAETVAALAAGPLVVDRPEHPYARNEDISAFEDYLGRELARFRDPREHPAEAAQVLKHLTHGFLSVFLHRVAADASGRHPGLPGALRIAAEAGAAAFRLARAPEGSELPVTVAGTTRLLPARPDAAGEPAFWKQAVALALVTGDRAALAACVLVEPGFLTGAEPVTAVAAYGAALHDYLRGADPVPAMDRALSSGGHAPYHWAAPPVVLLSQVVEGDREGFALALADTLEAHRERHTTGDRAGTNHAVLDLDALALVCHVRRMGWRVPVSSPYLPDQVLHLGARLDG